MALACVNSIGMSTENFLNCPPAKYPSYGWLSPRISFSRDFPEEDAPNATTLTKPSAKKLEEPDPVISGEDFVDFEFRLVDPVTMLPADELFSDGKFVPTHVTTIRNSVTSAPPSSDVRLPDTRKCCRREEISSADPYLYSPKAPRCSSSWKELLGLKKLYQNSNAKPKQEDYKTSSHYTSKNSAARNLKHFLHRRSKSSLNASIDSSLSLPLLTKDSDNDQSISSRHSLSSSSSGGHEHDDLPRLSLDSDKPSTTRYNHSRSRVVKHMAALSTSEKAPATNRVGRSTNRGAPVRGVSVDSPRMNSYGKIVFNRSSSSPSSFNGGPRYYNNNIRRHRGGMERSYSANVRVTPVLNVPVCSLSKSGLFGFPLFSSQQKNNNREINGTGNRKNRSDRT